MADNEMKKDKAFEEKKLNDEQLNDATGGGPIWKWIDSDLFYESGDKPKWELNKKVAFVHEGQIDYGVITAVSKKKDGGTINKEFTYTIRYYEGNEVSGIYESAIQHYAD